MFGWLSNMFSKQSSYTQDEYDAVKEKFVDYLMCISHIQRDLSKRVEVTDDRWAQLVKKTHGFSPKEFAILKIIIDKRFKDLEDSSVLSLIVNLNELFNFKMDENDKEDTLQR